MIEMAIGFVAGLIVGGLLSSILVSIYWARLSNRLHFEIRRLKVDALHSGVRKSR